MKRQVETSPERNANSVSPQKKVRVGPFDVRPAAKFNGKFPNFPFPEEIGSFSLDSDRDYVDDRSQLRVYSPPDDARVAWDLRHGYNTFIKRDESVHEHLDHLLQWAKLHKSIEFRLRSVNANAGSGQKEANTKVFSDFVCWRGLLTKLLCTPYENKEGWKIGVGRYRGTYYLCEFDMEQPADTNRFANPLQQEMTYWGFKFESYITSANEEVKPHPEDPVNNKQAFVSVVRTRLNNHTLVFGGEVDCCDKTDHKYIELKTSRLMDTANQRTNFKRFKLIKWWAQSFLIGIQKIVCGFRDDDGVVRQLEDFDTVSLPKYCQDVLRGPWSAEVCFNFCDQFLQHVKDVVESDYDESIYVFSWLPGEPVSCRLESPDSEYAFLPPWYTSDVAGSQSGTCCKSASDPTAGTSSDVSSNVTNGPTRSNSDVISTPTVL